MQKRNVFYAESCVIVIAFGVKPSDAEFRDGQEHCAAAVRRRLLVVQRTEGKSIVYFIAAKLLREQGRDRHC